MLGHIQGPRRFPHARTSGDDDQVARHQSIQERVDVGKAGGQAGDRDVPRAAVFDVRNHLLDVVGDWPWFVLRNH